MSLTAIVHKELGDLVREKRFGAWALTFLAFWTLILFLFLDSNQNALHMRDHPNNVLQLAIPAYFIFAIGFLILALFTLCDGITKEREAGMLAMVGAKPVVRWHLVLGKLFAGLAVYGGAFLVTLLPTAVFAAALGTPVLTYLVQLFLLPLFVLYVFLLGSGLLLGVAFSSSKAAIGTASALYIPLFLMIRNGPMSMLYWNYPFLEKVAAYTPFEAARQASLVIAYGGVMPWMPLVVTTLVGIASAALAFIVFQRQEVAA